MTTQENRSAEQGGVIFRQMAFRMGTTFKGLSQDQTAACGKAGNITQTLRALLMSKRVSISRLSVSLVFVFFCCSFTLISEVLEHLANYREN